MAFNGAGIFLRLYNWVIDAASNIEIRADRMDAEMDGFATGLSNCLTKDGQTTVLANLPMSGYKHTGVANASARNDYASYGQVQDGGANFAVASGTADAITATLTPNITTIPDGFEVKIRSSATNTSTTPTLALNGLPARTIYKNGGQALAVGDIPIEAVYLYNLENTRWELLNPRDVVDLSAYAPLVSPAFTGTPTAPTAANGTNTTQLATTAFVNSAGYATLSSPAFTGTPTAPTAANGTNTTQLATTAFAFGAVSTAVSGYTKLPNGLILQWFDAGSIAGASSATVTLPITFPTAIRQSWACMRQTTNSSTLYGVATDNTSNSQVTVRNYSGSTASFQGFAIGY